MLFTAAAAMACDGLPTPQSVTVSDEFGLDLAFATHADLHRWVVHMRLSGTARHTQPYNRDDVPKVLTNVWGVWRGVRVRLHCCEPLIDTPPQFLPEAVAA
ncbi:hypothetical protein [Salinispora vitiensis]|uniref:hypothetical protein n=1 Tax=Salinispora vitiensis TaxID=999544 RepID=UPI00037DF7C2|nr:hypothetical protein [Salinispora vitiensis]